MWIDEADMEIECGLGWIPAIERFLEVVRVIEKYHGVSGSVHSIKSVEGGLQLDMNLPVCDCEQAILQAAMEEWTSRICEICGHPGAQDDTSVRCEKHQGKPASTLSSIRPVRESGIPLFKEGIYIACSVGDHFWFSEYRFPDRFHLPYGSGRIIDQTTTPDDIECDLKTGRARVLKAKHDENMGLTFLDVNAYNKLYAPSTIQEIDLSDFEELKRISVDVDEHRKISRREAYRRYLDDHTEERAGSLHPRERALVNQLISEFDPGTEKHYITGRTALFFVPPDKPQQAIFEKHSTMVSGIHLSSTWCLLGDEGLYQSRDVVIQSGAILPVPLVAGHERALFDELYEASEKGDLPDISELCGVDQTQIRVWIEECDIPNNRKASMLRMLDTLEFQDDPIFW